MRLGDVSGSAFSIGGSNHTNSVTHHHGGGPEAGPGAEELLEAVRDLRAALVRLPRSTDRSELDGELDEVAGELEEADAVRPAVLTRLRGALERWAPLVESVGAAASLGGLLTAMGG
ncbi:hypothetical protein DEJ50_19990 [Streptomyces venezuelae]|uniref:Uncharacterized protein n=1 Tax=Streptomyces venezuelae TaxID=54571 RepID=A0A5P2D3M0_STRVZ|nr:hypothetical protein DEJ50_19990 [Streptomyces venezuelae]